MPYSDWLLHNGPDAAPTVRQAGRDYLHQGRVTLDSDGDLRVLTTVRGSEAYHVAVIYAPPANDVVMGCTCPFYEERREVCKHIWATLMSCESRGLMPGFTPDDDTEIILIEPHLMQRIREDAGLGQGADDEAAAPTGFVERYVSPVSPLGKAQARTRPAPQPMWKRQLALVSASTPPSRFNTWPAERQIVYVIDADATHSGEGLVVEVAYRQPKLAGQWSKLRSANIPQEAVPRLADPADRQVLALLSGASRTPGHEYSYLRSAGELPTHFTLPSAMARPMAKLICSTGRCMLRLAGDIDSLQPLRWDEAGEWRLWLDIAPDEANENFTITGSLRRGEGEMAIEDPVLIVGGDGVVFTTETAAGLDDGGAFGWAAVLRRDGQITVPRDQRDSLLETLLQQERLPELNLCEELKFEQVRAVPKPRLLVRAEKQQTEYDRLAAELSFDYDGVIVPITEPRSGVYQAESRRLIRRDPASEQAALALLRQVGFREGYGVENVGDTLSLLPKHLPRAVQALTQAGWHVEAQGTLYRQANAFSVDVRSGVDWFELHAAADFNGQSIGLPELLRALKRGDRTIQLDDGTIGILPEQWLQQYSMLAGLAQVDEGHLRFSRGQAGLLDALLSTIPEASFDEVFARVQKELHSFEGVKPLDPPAGFVGELRPYQRDGLGWLFFLQRFGFGGCLADDMGLGKTVQVLALLETRREKRGQEKSGVDAPSLVVVPRSLIFNWKAEAARFSPKLRVLDHTGAGRTEGSDHFEDFDLVLTTYGTLRRDAQHFKDTKFDYVILDEAQAVKNIRTESAKAVRLLRGNHRLALSGTPVENHLGELWSLMDFLNPGILGAASAFNVVSGNGPLDEPTRRLLARGLRPFILRRTKEQVAADLPQKLEQTVYCEMPAEQRKLYDELRNHYRTALLGRIDKVGLGKSKMHVLEALLRLRQAACHPGLIDPAKIPDRSAKLDVLLSRLDEVADEGHKALVFSQFTSLLAIVRDRLDKSGRVYEYLDGKTVDREARVERFQTDPDCKLFLISLKAGGLGLNLTAADYVFLLDPWWNPAVEAQAIDRAHRIGQTRQVFACRLIAKGTVEEKVLELQQSKRNLADAIINADNSLIRTLGREDLELLLS
jgi:superfamily II DNA or RNA helicase